MVFRVTLCALLLSLGGCALFQPRGDQASGAAAGELPEVDIPYTRYVLDNGLRLIVHEDRKTPIVSVHVWYHVGSKDERPGRTGFAHLFEHLMFNGSENHDDEFFRPLEEVGATSMNGTTNTDRTNYFANVPTPALDRLLWLESDRMGHLLGAITQDKLDEQRGVVKNEKREGLNRPYGRVWSEIPRHSYPAGHPYSWEIIGSMEDLDAASLEDVHQWFRNYYGAANAVIVIAGDIAPEEALEKVQRYFGHIPGGPELSRPARWPAPMDSERRIELEDKVPHARVMLVWNVAPGSSRDALELDLLSDILASGKTSRLHERLVYRDQSATNAGAFLIRRELGSQFVLYATARPESDIAVLEQHLLEELERLLASGPTADELERARTRKLADFVRGIQRIGGFGGKADILARGEVLEGDPDAWRRHKLWYESATGEGLSDTGRRWLGEGRLALTVRPRTPGQVSAAAVDRSRLPHVGAAKPLALPPAQRATLSNGVEVVLVERHDAPLVNLLWLSEAGFAADPPDRGGLARLTMTLMQEGAGGRDALALDDELDRLGAVIRSHASLDLCTVSLSALSSRLVPALDLYADILRRPDFPPQELDRKRPLLLAAIEQEQANPSRLAMRVLPPLLFGAGHPYGVPFTGSGTPQSVNAISLDDVRNFHRQWIRPEISRLLVVGDTTMETILPLLEARLGDWDDPSTAGIKVLGEPRLIEAPRVYLLNRPHAEQSVIIAGMLAPDIHDPDNIAMVTANNVLGGLFTSRLNMNLREDKGWSYGAGTSLVDTRAQRPLLTYSRVQSDRTADSMREILREINALRKSKPPTDAELDTARKNQTLSLPGRNETVGQVADSYAHILEHGLPDSYFNDYVGEVLALTPAAVSAGARKLLNPEQLVWVVVGDVQRIEAGIRALNLGDVVILNPQ